MIETIRSLLALPQAYNFFFRIIGAPERSRILVREYIRARPEDRILEIGCGPGTIVPYLPSSEYIGFDASEEYIEEARRRFPDRGKFICERVSQYSLPQRDHFDITLALGILHHIDDAEALQLFQIAHAALKPGGRLVTLDGVWVEGQSRASRYIQARDRGQFIRDERSYITLASKIFGSIESSIRHDLLRIPYTHVILVCRK